MLFMTLGMVSPVLICLVTNGIIARACKCTSVTSFNAQALEALQSHKKFFRRNKLSFERRSLRKKICSLL
jgi:hypothetical protein